MVRIDRRKLTKYVNDNIREALIDVGGDLVDKIRDSMVPGHGRRYKRRRHMIYNVHFSSAPGRPPAPWTYRLRDSIMFHSSFGDKSIMGPAAKRNDGIKRPCGAMDAHIVSVGTNVEYALNLEKGSKKLHIQARPFLWPALKSSRGLIKEAFNRV